MWKKWIQNRERDARVEAIIKHAETYLGMRSRAMRSNGFGSAVGYEGSTWDGSFIETVLRETETGGVPALTSTTSALAEFVRDRRIFDKPQVGDIVFFNFSTASTFGQPHVGLVTDVERWHDLGQIKTIEGETSSGMPKGPQDPDGVYRRTRFESDVAFFARPTYRARDILPDKDAVQPKVLVDYTMFQVGKQSIGVRKVQEALFDVQGSDHFLEGTWDKYAVSATARYQRSIGNIHANGIMDNATLHRLAKDTYGKYFRVRS